MRACVYKRVCNERLCVQMGVQSGVQTVCVCNGVRVQAGCVQTGVQGGRSARGACSDTGMHGVCVRARVGVHGQVCKGGCVRCECAKVGVQQGECEGRGAKAFVQWVSVQERSVQRGEGAKGTEGVKAGVV